MVMNDPLRREEKKDPDRQARMSSDRVVTIFSSA